MPTIKISFRQDDQGRITLVIDVNGKRMPPKLLTDTRMEAGPGKRDATLTMIVLDANTLAEEIQRATAGLV